MTLKMFAAGAAAAFAAVALFGTVAEAQTQRKKGPRPVLVRAAGPNVSYQQGPRTRVYVTKRSWLDAGTEVLPGERKFSDYAFPPGYCASCAAVPRTPVRAPLSDTPYDLGGYPLAIPLY